MSNKRKAEYQLDREKYNEQAESTRIRNNELVSETDKIWTQEEISQRKVYKAKRIRIPGNSLGVKPQTQGKNLFFNHFNLGNFKILGVLNVKKVEKKEPIVDTKNSEYKIANDSVFKPPKPSPKSDFAKRSIVDNNAKSEPNNSFSSKLTSAKTEITKSVFVNKPDPDSSKRLMSVFGSSTSNKKAEEKSIFKKNDLSNKKSDTKNESIFKGTIPEKKNENKSNMIFQPQSTGSRSIFGSIKQTQNEESKGQNPAPKIGLFDKDTQPSQDVYKTLFQKEDKSKKESIFDKTPSQRSQKAITVNKKGISATLPVNSSRSLFDLSSTKGVQRKNFNAKKKDADQEIDDLLDDPQPKVPQKDKQTSIFGKGNKDITKDTKLSSINKDSKVSLFGNSAKTQFSFGKPKEQDQNKKSAFGESKFAPKTTEKLSLAGNSIGGSKSMFNKGSLFSSTNSLTKPEDQKQSFIKSGESAKNEEENDEVPKEDDKPKFKAINRDEYKKIYNKSVERFKTQKQDKGNGILTIETGEDKQKKRFVIINFRNPIGKTLFTGQIVEGCKKMQACDKPGKIQLKLLLTEKDQESGKMKPIFTIVTFARTDDRNEFDKSWEQSIDFIQGK